LRSVNPNDEEALEIIDIAEQFASTGLFDIMAFVGYFVGGLILLSGGIGISNPCLLLLRSEPVK
jgi:putative ABC transport system permease protein